MGRLFRAHQKRFAGGVIPTAGLLLQSVLALQRLGLSMNLERERATHPANRIHVFDLNLRPKLGLGFRPDRDVAITTQLPLLHVSIADAAIDQDLFERGQKRERLFRRINFRLGHDLHQRRARAVEINPGLCLKMKTLRHIFFEMDPDEMDLLVRSRDAFLRVFGISQIVQGHRAIFAQRHVVLGNLIIFRHVRIEIIFPVELADRGNVAVEHQAGEHGHAEGFVIHRRQRAR